MYDTRMIFTSLYRKHLAILTGAVVLSIGISILLPAQDADDSIEKKVTGSCWSSEVAKEVGGKCPTDIKDTLQICLVSSMAGGINGTATAFHTEFLKVDKIKPDQILECGVKPRSTVTFYDLAAKKTASNSLSITATSHRCGVGDCGNLDKTVFKGTLSVSGESMLFARADGTKLKMVKAEQKDGQSNSDNR